MAVAVWPRATDPGGDYLIGVAAFLPCQAMSLHLYRRAEGADCQAATSCWSFAAALPPVMSDDRGQGLAQLLTHPDDALGE